MPVKSRTWISLWFLLSTPVVLWDAGYCFSRPRSFEGGDLHWIWKPYALYAKVDHIYGRKAYEAGDGFPNAQAFMNLIEIALNYTYLYLVHVKPWPAAAVFGFAAAAMTVSKTLLYMVQEYYCGYCMIGHNTFVDILMLWVVPNGFWVVFPLLVVCYLGKDLVESCNYVQERGVAQKTK